MKKISLLFVFLAFAACKTQDNSPKTENVSPTTYAASITPEALSKHLYVIASDEFEGRNTGEKGQKLAADYLVNFYTELGIAPGNGDSYFQQIPSSYFKDRYGDSENVLAFIKGTELPEEVIVVSAHYDHVGMDDDGNIFNGADDDGSGTVAVMQIAEAFQKAVKDGNGPKRSLLFLHVTAEEIGLLGSKFYSENPVHPLENTVSNLNIDMIGRTDTKHQEGDEYIYLIGADRLSTELHELSVAVNENFTKLDLDFTYNAEDEPMRLYYRSDHYNFAKHDIPSIFYFSGLHEDYHQPTDTADKIDYPLLAKRSQLVFHTAWEIANREKRLVVDKPTK